MLPPILRRIHCLSHVKSGAKREIVKALLIIGEQLSPTEQRPYWKKYSVATVCGRQKYILRLCNVVRSLARHTETLEPKLRVIIRKPPVLQVIYILLRKYIETKNTESLISSSSEAHTFPVACLQLSNKNHNETKRKKRIKQQKKNTKE